MNAPRWYVLVEETVTRSAGNTWQLSQVHPANDVEHLFRTQDGGWIVRVEGKSMTFHFRVSVAEYYGDFPASPSA